MIPFRGSSGIDMKRLLPVLLALTCLLCACSSSHTFLRDDGGAGYTDTETNIYYLALDPQFEAMSAGEVLGEYEDKTTDTVYSFRVIPELDPTLFLTDNDQNVYYAGEGAFRAADWQLHLVLICEEDAIAVERLRLSAPEAAQSIADLRTLWFEGDTESLPTAETTENYTLKMMTPAFPNLMYSISLYCYADGAVYLYDAFSHRARAVPATLAAKLLPTAQEVVA